MDRLTKSTHFLSVWVNYSLDNMANLYIDEIMKLHGILVGIVSDVICDLLQDFGIAYSKLWELC